jgi:hypothetical protein
MSNPTSNFNWQMPTATDLVTDLPADFEVFGQAVDTSLADLKGGTTGQVLKKNTNTDMDFVWGTVAGDIEGVTAGVGITGGGTSGTVTITNDMATTITTNGDLLYGTGSGTYTRRAIGSAGQVLTVSSGVPAWTTPAAGAYTSLATGSLSGSALSITSIPNGYQDLVLVMTNFYSSTDLAYMTATVNNTTGIYLTGVGAGGYSPLTPTSTSMNTNAELDNTSNKNFLQFNILQYASSNYKFARQNSMTKYDSTQVGFWDRIYGIDLGSAVNRIDFTLNSGTFTAGTYTLYGVK